ncbi:MAG: amphi-Trp domain-containing protein [Deltaproteobacteria bacterium]|nr:amphi-Trp domain-containing protein [Deltaproteobacteria bacterium]
MDKPKIELKNSMGRSEVIAYLEGLVEGFKAGKIVLEQGAQVLEMTVPEVVQVEVEARQKKDKAKFALELTWYQIADTDECDFVKISAQNPEKAALAAGFEEVGDKEPKAEPELKTEPKVEKDPKAGKGVKSSPETPQPEKDIKPMTGPCKPA